MYINIIIFQIIPVSAFALGTWQIKRKIGKEEQIKKLKEVTKSDIVELPAKYVS